MGGEVCNVFQLFKDTLNVHRNMENIDICHRVCALYHKMALANVLFLVLRLRGDGGGRCRNIRNIHI